MKQLFTSVVSPTEGNPKYVLPGLDGLRAIAVSLVIIYHLWPTALPGGMIGVDIFFVISGYLITALLLREGYLTGRINLPQFWIRRARRLLPAIALLILIIGPVTQLIGGDIKVSLDRQVLGAATFSSNWLSISAGNDYFAQTSPEVFTNFWSLAVEEQFYVLWPLLLVLAGLLLGKRWRIFALVVAALAVFSVVSSAFLVAAQAPISRVYYGTDTHMYGLLIGVLLAFSRPWSLYPPAEKARLYAVAQPFGAVAFVRVLLSWACLIALIPYALLMDEKSSFFVPWGLLGASFLSVGVIQGLLPDMHAGASELLRKVLSSQPLLWIGQRSYGLYLWHWPLAVIAHYLYGPERSFFINCAVVIATVVIAELSYRFVETPVRRHGFRECTARVFGAFRAVKVIPIAAAVLLLGCATTTAVAVSTAPQMTSAQASVENGKKAAAERLEAKKAARSASPTADNAQTGQPQELVKDGKPNIKAIDSKQVSIIGDSIVVASQADLFDVLPDAQVDAAEARSIAQVVPMVQSMASEGKIPKVLVLSVTANSTFTPEQLEQILQAMPADSKLVVATGYGPSNLSWIESSNTVIREFAQKNSSRVFIADWNSVIKEELKKNPNLMTSDGTHPDLSGQVIYARVIAEAVAQAQAA